MRMFIKLFVIKIVPNNFLGFSSSFTTVLFSFEDAERESNSVCEIEKKATSVPETKAEQSNKKSNKKQFTAVSKSILDSTKNKELGSVSKI